jgi:hypothetical protein
MKWLLGAVVSLVVVVTVVTAGLAGHRFVLVAQGDVPVDSYPAPGSTPIARLHAGERATVLSCDDLKSYPAVHVRLANGTEGYVIEGRYELAAASIWDRSSDSPIVFFCPKY